MNNFAEDSKDILIAVVEDDDTSRELIVNILKNNGYKTIEASSAEEAKKLIGKNRPDLAVLDVMMPDMDGFQLCRILKKEYQDDLPIVFLTALDDDESRSQGLAAGCDEFLTKPVNSVELLTRIRNLTRISQLARQLKLRREVAGRLCGKEETVANTCEKEECNILIVEDSPFYQILLEEYLKSCADKLTIVSSGKEALEYLEKDSFDLMLLDLFLPDMSGIDVLKEVRKMDKTKYLPVIVITASDDTLKKVEGIEAGANDYLVKPVDRLELNARVRSLLKSQRLQNSLRGSYMKAVEEAMKDGMTGLYNNSYFKQFLQEEIDYCEKTGKPLSLLMMDLDDFKDYNDTNGHPLGDIALQETAAIIVENIRSSDLAARYGGEEFAVVLPGATLDTAKKIAERIRREVEDHHYTQQGKMKRGNLTISIGVAAFEKGLDVLGFLKKADSALYKAKRSGKNVVV